MPLPIAGIALRYGIVALAGAAIAKRAMKARQGKDIYREAAWSDVDDGLTVERVENEDEVQLEGAHGHLQRIWFGGRGIELDSRILARLRIRKLNEKDKK